MNWSDKSFLTYCLLPFSWLFHLIVLIRKKAYQSGLLKTEKCSVPVIVVGNITVGGSGKTPIVIALTEALKAEGYRPGIISRGYRGKSKEWPRSVNQNSDPKQVGDEAVLMAIKTNCPVVVGPDRVKAATQCLRENNCDLLISDDGLQHYALERDMEIAVINSDVDLGNGFLLPAGPLRETPSRLKKVDCVLVNGIATQRYHDKQFSVVVKPGEIYQLKNPNNKLNIDRYKNQNVFAIAGIANPNRFLVSLHQLGFTKITPLFYRDHHDYFPEDINLPGEHLIIMTEKDAVKCRRYANERHWVLPINVNLPNNLLIEIQNRIFL